MRMWIVRKRVIYAAPRIGNFIYGILPMPPEPARRKFWVHSPGLVPWKAAPRPRAACASLTRRYITSMTHPLRTPLKALRIYGPIPILSRNHNAWLKGLPLSTVQGLLTYYQMTPPWSFSCAPPSGGVVRELLRYRGYRAARVVHYSTGSLTRDPVVKATWAGLLTHPEIGPWIRAGDLISAVLVSDGPRDPLLDIAAMAIDSGLTPDDRAWPAAMADGAGLGPDDAATVAALADWAGRWGLDDPLPEPPRRGRPPRARKARP